MKEDCSVKKASFLGALYWPLEKVYRLKLPPLPPSTNQQREIRHQYIDVSSEPEDNPFPANKTRKSSREAERPPPSPDVHY